MHRASQHYFLLQDIVSGLAEKGHFMNNKNSHCVVQGISKLSQPCPDDECITAVCDGRKDGIPDGF